MPPELKEGAYGLGLTRWEMVRGVIVPYTRGGVVAAVLLGMGRAVGEAIAVTQVIGGFAGIRDPLFQPGDTLASRIAAQYQGAASNLHVASIVYLALILLVFALLTNVAAQVIVNRFEARTAGADGGAGAAAALAARGRRPRPPAEAPVNRAGRGLLARGLGSSRSACSRSSSVSVFVEALEALNCDLFTKTPATFGESGGGIAHAFVGSLVLVGIGSGNGAADRRADRDLRQRVRRPSARPRDQAVARRSERSAVDRDRHLPLRPARRRAGPERLHRRARARRSSWCRSISRSTQEVLALVPNHAARGELRARRQQMADDRRRDPADDATAGS